jgi:hypothetical protein
MTASDKPRLVEVIGDEQTLLRQALSLSVPYLVENDGRWYADADDLKRWRKLRESQSQSAAEPK